MAENSNIGWTDATWNPMRGCTRVSPGCADCYAETCAERWRGIAGHPYERGFDPRIVPERLEDPLKWKKPRRIFVNSMSDFFHEAFSDQFIERVCEVMIDVKATHHTFQVLTKRSERLRYFLKQAWDRDCEWSRLDYQQAPNIWWGVSCENRKHGLPRLEHLRGSGVAVNFVSFEPLLEDLGQIDLSEIGWVIVGGESGPGRRPCEIDWIVSIVGQCADAGVPCYVKQDSGFKPGQQGRIPDDIWAVKEFPGVGNG